MSKKKNLGDLITDNKENAEKLSATDIKADSDKDKIGKKISKLILENKQNALELSAAYKIITIQKKEIKKQAADLFHANKELALKAELSILNKELLMANKQEKLAKEKYFELYNFAPTGILHLTEKVKSSSQTSLLLKLLVKNTLF